MKNQVHRVVFRLGAKNVTRNISSVFLIITRILIACLLGTNAYGNYDCWRKPAQLKIYKLCY